ncbi:MAG: hypothetical protein KDB00_12865 [Planctomycetales bacterium]|nr:hypothetical protein [Planctomycetales bacterium]
MKHAGANNITQLHGDPAMLIRLFAIPAAFFAFAVFTATCSAQYQVYPAVGGYGSNSSCPTAQRYQSQGYGDTYQSYRPSLHHGHSVSHHADVIKLDDWADKLAESAKHLHEDAHQLGQDYEHSEGIEASVAKLDRLNEHMHEILHHAADRQYLSASEIRHVSNDVAQVRRLAVVLDRELEHQRFDGARTQDFHALDHMRQILAGEVFPLVRNMEFELDFRSTPHHDSMDYHHGHDVHYFGH